MLVRVDHLDITVRDLEKHVEFFQMLGFEVLGRTEHAGGAVELRPPGPDAPIFEFHQATGTRVIGLQHIAFTVDNVQEVYEKLKGKGVTMEGEPHRNQFTGRLVANFRDPDGWLMQVTDAQGGESRQPSG